MGDKQKVFFGVPTYKADCHVGILSVIPRMTRKHQAMFGNVDSSACCVTFNALYIMALEEYEKGNADWFLLWHSDIVPEPYFLDKMIDIAEEKQADILSVVAPIKDEKGLTSTALDEPVGDVPLEWRVRRLTMTEIMQREETFTAPNLLINTGLMLVRLSVPWRDQIRFHFEDQIIRVHGRRRAVVMPEDWLFSRDARKLGCTSQWATRAIKLEHKGMATFPNSVKWGTKETDAEPPTPPDIMEAVTEADRIAGWMAWDELAYLATKAKDAKVIVELGSWKGRSTKAMAMTTKGRIYAVDSWRGSTEGDATGVEATERGRDAIKGEFYDNVGTPHAKSVVVVDCEHAFAGQALRDRVGEVDFAFIDGDHQYEHVKRDILTCLDLMAPGGVLCGHDTNEPGVLKAVNELLPGAKVVAGSIWEYKVPTVAAIVSDAAVTANG